MFELLHAALSGMIAGPRNLPRALEYQAQDHWQGPGDFEPGLLLDFLRAADPGDPTLSLLRRRLAQWDNESAEWATNTPPNTAARRAAIYTNLGFDKDWIAFSDQSLQFHQVGRATVIAEEHTPWYDDQVIAANDFYWSRYRQQLEKQGWGEASLIELDESTRSIIERLADPSAAATYQSKGLVVGYVQSGKTANFTGVIAKAADAGYKLIIVLGGMLDVLRTQTQRRLDKELIGRELLGVEYNVDPDYNEFVAHGARPSQLGAFDFYRLTGSLHDYESLAYGRAALELRAPDPAKPFWDRGNLQRTKTLIAVVKKHSGVLQKLLKDFHDVEREGTSVPLADIPALIIDDESDQASINIRPPDADERTATNNAIVQLLAMLPRGQYVGYTATPFANVFIDPSDDADIFPKDFLISLPRPVGYMGVSDFYDFETPIGEQGPNERDYVRGVERDDDDPDNLPKAIDAFVLSGALKIYRAARDPTLKFRHHTMLAHLSQFQGDHAVLARTVREIYARAGYEGGDGLDRLKRLLEGDYRRVYAARGEGLAFPQQFEELEDALGECLQKIGDAHDAVLVLNTENRKEAPDFEKRPVWKILVGGAKLSRGYTVEGLTVSYYRRRAGAGDTLMQMGRWFGFRRGYRDLVRLFIGINEPVGRTARRINLYEAFGAICRDEEYFREELKRYAKMEERITPAKVAPLVPQHMLRPTAANKMRNAQLLSRNFGGALAESTFAPTNAQLIEENIALMRTITDGKSATAVDLQSAGYAMRALTLPLSTAEIIDLLEGYCWFDPNTKESRQGNPMALQIEFLKGRAGDHQIADWLLLGPKIKPERRKGSFNLAGGEFDIVYRSRHEEQRHRFNTYNDPIHRKFARHIVGQEALAGANSDLTALTRPHRGVLMFYAVTDEETPGATMAFTLLFPHNDIRTPLAFTVRRKDRPPEAIVDI